MAEAQAFAALAGAPAVQASVGLSMEKLAPGSAGAASCDNVLPSRAERILPDVERVSTHLRAYREHGQRAIKATWTRHTEWL